MQGVGYGDRGIPGRDVPTRRNWAGDAIGKEECAVIVDVQRVCGDEPSVSSLQADGRASSSSNGSPIGERMLIGTFGGDGKPVNRSER